MNFAWIPNPNAFLLQTLMKPLGLGRYSNCINLGSLSLQHTVSFSKLLEGLENAIQNIQCLAEHKNSAFGKHVF